MEFSSLPMHDYNHLTKIINEHISNAEPSKINDEWKVWDVVYNPFY